MAARLRELPTCHPPGAVLDPCLAFERLGLRTFPARRPAVEVNRNQLANLPDAIDLQENFLGLNAYSKL